MINKDFWEKIAEKWITKSDGIAIPEIKVNIINEEELGKSSYDSISDELVDDILADLGFDDI